MSDTLDSYIQRVFPCRGPSECNSYGICDNCGESVLLRAGASIQAKIMQHRIDELTNGLQMIQRNTQDQNLKDLIDTFLTR